MASRKILLASSAGAMLLLVACDHSAKIARAPAPEAARAEAKGSRLGPWSDETDATQSSPTEDPADGADATPSASPLGMLNKPEVAFLIDYTQCDLYRRAAESCAKEANDLARHAECLARARDEVPVDVIRFKTDDAGNRWWVTYKRHGSVLAEEHSSEVSFVNVAPHSVTLALQGPELGRRPIFKSASRIVVSVPDVYTLELDEPKLGHLVYRAKVGLVGP